MKYVELRTGSSAEPARTGDDLDVDLAAEATIGAN